MILFVTIPAYNEENTVGEVIKSIPRSFKGIKQVKVLVWSDGSTDGTVAAAEQAGADYVFASKRNLGLARTFDLATSKAVELGADIVVNTDADNQYDQQEIPLLLAPILASTADVVSGDRQVPTLTHMSQSKQLGNRLGSWTIRLLTNLPIQDASSGFRAYTAAAIKQLRVFSRHTYTHETLIQAAYGDLAVTEVPITFRARTGDAGSSRLISGVFSHIIKSASTIVRTILMYRAFKYLVTLGLILIGFSVLLGVRYIYFLSVDPYAGHVQSLILASMLFTLGLTTVMVGLLADLISINRKMYTKS